MLDPVGSSRKAVRRLAACWAWFLQSQWHRLRRSGWDIFGALYMAVELRCVVQDGSGRNLPKNNYCKNETECILEILQA